MKHSLPTFGEVLEAYPEVAALERIKNERPCPTTVRNTLCGVKRILAATGTPLDFPLSRMTRRRVDSFLFFAHSKGLSPHTSWAYVGQLRALVARWTRPYYEARGWKVRDFDLPGRRLKASRYVRPERETLLKVRDWYEALAFRRDKREWLAATLMLEFAMRNGDAARLKWSDFRERDGAVFLFYTPHKTALSSARTVAWPVHPALWEQMKRARDSTGRREGTHFQGLVVPAAKEIFSRLNSDIRARNFFTGTGKRAYELRKICIDHIYQKFGAEMASSISGDDIRTVTRYYADPSAVNIRGIRIIDLL